MSLDKNFNLQTLVCAINLDQSPVSLIPRLSSLELGTFYYMCDNVRGKQDLITTEPAAHACSSVSSFKTTTVFFSGRYGFRLCSQRYIASHLNYSPFLESVLTTWSITTLAYNTQHMKFLAIQPIRCCV